jgi:hypothetical protein
MRLRSIGLGILMILLGLGILLGSTGAQMIAFAHLANHFTEPNPLMGIGAAYILGITSTLMVLAFIIGGIIVLGGIRELAYGIKY